MISASEFMLLVERKAIEGHVCYIISLVINICAQEQRSLLLQQKRKSELMKSVVNVEAMWKPLRLVAGRHVQDAQSLCSKHLKLWWRQLQLQRSRYALVHLVQERLDRIEPSAQVTYT